MSPPIGRAIWLASTRPISVAASQHQQRHQRKDQREGDLQSRSVLVQPSYSAARPASVRFICARIIGSTGRPIISISVRHVLSSCTTARTCVTVRGADTRRPRRSPPHRSPRPAAARLVQFGIGSAPAARASAEDQPPARSSARTDTATGQPAQRRSAGQELAEAGWDSVPSAAGGHIGIRSLAMLAASERMLISRCSSR